MEILYYFALQFPLTDFTFLQFFKIAIELIQQTNQCLNLAITPNKDQRQTLTVNSKVSISIFLFISSLKNSPLHSFFMSICHSILILILLR